MRKDIIFTGVTIFLVGYINGIVADPKPFGDMVVFLASGLELLAQILGIIMVIVGLILKKK